jgi:uncharacterized membrane protein YkoI
MIKKIIFSVALTGALVAAPLSTVLAAASTETTSTTQIKSTVLPISEILKRLETAGYRVYHKIELNNDVYEAKAISKQGDEVKIEINAKTGALVEPKDEKDHQHLTLLQVANKVESSGYHTIRQIKTDGAGYKVKALNAKGDSVKLFVDAKTGKIEKTWF